MAIIDDFLKKLPPDTRKNLELIWNSLPASDKQSIIKIISAFPKNSTQVNMLVDLATRQYKVITGSKHTVAIVGPANVGKSTLYNQLIHEKEDKAHVSPVPGTTRVNQQADSGLFSIIDTPGADAVGYVGEEEKKQAMDTARSADFLVIMFDAIQGIKQSELQLFNDLLALSKPYIVVLNKMDLVKKEEQLVIAKSAANLRLDPNQVIPIAAKDGKAVSDVVMAIAIAEPSLITALGRTLPEFRWKLAWRTIASASSLCAAIALTPLPVLDFGPLVITQSVMVLSLARIYDYKINLARARELILTFGLGLIGRTLFAQLSKLGGVPGWLLSSAIASSITVVLGYAVVVMFDRNRRLTKDELNRLTKTLTSFLLDRLKNLGKSKPNQKTLQETILQALEESGMPGSTEILDAQVLQSNQEIVIDERQPPEDWL
ncbi:MAG TPA: 50S ribosome-binding GTPase [Anaerolineaceae bacterium]|nr:50S ribosome-binding GTPase [Anaerolineaceae bacterium]HQP08365.1 50S ribosome-binding GTPase [Anaerolineaceae bacterium]